MLNSHPQWQHSVRTASVAWVLLISNQYLESLLPVNLWFSIFNYLSLIRVSHCIRSINDPEHPLTLEELNVVDISHVTVS